MIKKALFIMALSGLTPGDAFAQAWQGPYPVSKKTDHVDNYFGKNVKDPYRWLEDDRSTETADWVGRQNEATQKYLSKIPFRENIKKRLTQLWNYEKYSAPFEEGGWLYFYKNDGLQNQSVLYRQRPGKTTKPEKFLDPNKFSKDGSSSLAGVSFSPDGSLIGIQISEAGSDWRKVVILSAVTKKQIGDTLYDVKFSGISWKGNDGFYYSSYDKPKKGSALSGKTQIHKLFYHKMGTRQASDSLVFGGEKMERRYIWGSVTESQKYLVINAANTTTGSELYIQDLTKKEAPIVPLMTGFDNESTVVSESNGKLYIQTNYNAPNKRLVVTDAGNTDPEMWKDVIAESNSPLEVTTAGKFFFAHYLKDAVSKIEMFDSLGNRLDEIELPGLGTASGFSGKVTAKDVYYTFSSYIYPATIYKYNLTTKESSIYRKSSANVQSENFESKQVFYSVGDGTIIPMIITGKKGFQLDGKNPTMLYGYGGFGVSLSPGFSMSNYVFMENGGLYAVANIRGGGEYGDFWHNSGIKRKKQNVFDDFIAAAQFLIENKYTSKEFLAISGGSNGGLLVGACMTQRPDLFQVCFPAVGVLDMLRYHQFTAGAGWAYDYGTANDDVEMFTYLYGYSPLHNIKEGTCYPATMVTTADHDDRVVPAHSFKFAATLQAAQGCDQPALIRIETNAGHGAGKPTSKIIEEQTDKWAFMLYNMGLNYTVK